MRYFTPAPDLSCVRNFSNYGYYTGSRAVNGKAVADRLERVINDDALSRLRERSRTTAGEARIDAPLNLVVKSIRNDKFERTLARLSPR